MAERYEISEYTSSRISKDRRALLSVSLELTVRCNNNCIHCYNNLNEYNSEAMKNELSTDEVKNLVDQIVEMGVLWIHLTGGEVLLRKDFNCLYEYMIRKGLLVSIFTNATLISDEHIELFSKYRPRKIEITVYGIPEKVYTKVTRSHNFNGFINGVETLSKASIPFTLKSVLIKDNYKNFKEIYEFSTKKSNSSFRFDPLLFFRTDGNEKRNRDIVKQRLSNDEIIELEKQNIDRVIEFNKMCNDAMNSETNTSKNIFQCGAGLNSCYISSNGTLRLCNLLVKKPYTYDLRRGSLHDAWNNFVPAIRALEADMECKDCKLTGVCGWCPARADLEFGKLNKKIDYFCDITKSRHAYCIKFA